MIAVHPRFHWLDRHASNQFSAHGEDGVLETIFYVIRAANEWCFECGAADGLFLSNTRRLVENGWHALLVEADAAEFQRLVHTTSGFGARVRCLNERIGRDNPLEGVLARCGAPVDLDLVVIDVDGQDYYLLASIQRYRPRVIVIEFDRNAEEDFIPSLEGPGQAGERAIAKLAAAKFYTAVYRNVCNLVLVRQPLDRLLDGSRPELQQLVAA